MRLRRYSICVESPNGVVLEGTRTWTRRGAEKRASPIASWGIGAAVYVRKAPMFDLRHIRENP